MKNIWKWILGILVVLVVIALIGGAAFMFRGRMMSASFRPGFVQQQQQKGTNVQPNMPGLRQNGKNFVFRGPMVMMGGRGFGRMGGGFGFFGGFFQLVIFALLLYGAYWLGRRNARIAIDPKPAPAQPAQVAETPKAE